MTITIYHNPACGTSRKVLEAIRAAGHAPEVMEYLKLGWTKPQLQALFAAAGVTGTRIRRCGRPIPPLPRWV